MARWVTLLGVLLIPICSGAILGDLNKDGKVDFSDFFLFSDQFGKEGSIDPPDTVVVVRVDTLWRTVRDTVVVVRVDTLRQVVRDTVVVGEPLVLLPGGATMEMVWIEPGTFMMGSPASGPYALYAQDDEMQHQVTITKGFYLGKYELTQGQWQAVMGTQPWSGERFVQMNPYNPAVYISWNDMQAFIHKLNQAAGDSLYRLPTEAEWEYACRAGTMTRWSFGDSEGQLGEYEWYTDNVENVGDDYALAVGTRLPNPWGLFDMHGNVAEVVQDFYGNYPSSSQTDPQGPSSGYNRVVRGGNFFDSARYTRSAERSITGPNFTYYGYGARLVKIK